MSLFAFNKESWMKESILRSSLLMDGPSDRPLNHGVLFGATVAKATIDGGYDGCHGTIKKCSVNTTVAEEGTSFRISYDVFWYDREILESLSALEILRKS